jgi:hypothetical protein
MAPEPTSSAEQAGICPGCSTLLPVSAGELIHWGGTWSGRTLEGRPCGGSVWRMNCPSCGVLLETLVSGREEAANARSKRWVTKGLMAFSGDDWRRGRTGVWSEENSGAFRKQLCELAASHQSLESAILKLHCTSGLGAIHLVRLVRETQSCSVEVSNRIVLRAIAPHLTE